MRKYVFVISIIALLITAGLIQAGRPIVLSTDKDVYETGETVTLFVSNEGKKPITIRSGFYVTTADKHIAVFDPFWAVFPGITLEERHSKGLPGDLVDLLVQPISIDFIAVITQGGWDLHKLKEPVVIRGE